MLTRSGLDIVVGRALGTVVMTIRGPLKKASATELKHSVDEVLGEHPERVVLDLTGVPDFDDDAVSVLAKAQAAAHKSNVQLQLTSRRAAARAKLSDTGLDVVEPT